MSAPSQERQISSHSWRPAAYNEQRSRLGAVVLAKAVVRRFFAKEDCVL